MITSSCLDNAGKKLVRQQLCILGGHMVNEWSNDCSLVVMNKISVTIKVSVESRGPGFEPHKRHRVVSLSKAH